VPSRHALQKNPTTKTQPTAQIVHAGKKRMLFCRKEKNAALRQPRGGTVRRERIPSKKQSTEKTPQAAAAAMPIGRGRTPAPHRTAHRIPLVKNKMPGPPAKAICRGVNQGRTVTFPKNLVPETDEANCGMVFSPFLTFLCKYDIL